MTALPIAFLAIVNTPPMPETVRRMTGYLLRELQDGRPLSMPHSKPMPSVGPGVHELRADGQNVTWRVFYRLDSDAVVVIHAFQKKTKKTPQREISTAVARLKTYDAI